MNKNLSLKKKFILQQKLQNTKVKVFLPLEKVTKYALDYKYLRAHKFSNELKWEAIYFFHLLIFKFFT